MKAYAFQLYVAVPYPGLVPGTVFHFLDLWEHLPVRLPIELSLGGCTLRAKPEIS